MCSWPPCCRCCLRTLQLITWPATCKLSVRCTNISGHHWRFGSPVATSAVMTARRANGKATVVHVCVCLQVMHAPHAVPSTAVDAARAQHLVATVAQAGLLPLSGPQLHILKQDAVTAAHAASGLTVQALAKVAAERVANALAELALQRCSHA